ncbi:MAG: hypothetical protein RSE10_08385 [Oscillospiraceae bacterium]
MIVEGVSLSDPLTGKIWRLGSEIKVKLIGVDVAHGNIDFAPEE